VWFTPGSGSHWFRFRNKYVLLRRTSSGTAHNKLYSSGKRSKRSIVIFLLVGSDSGSRYSNEGIRGTDRISIMMLGKATARSQISSLIEEVPLQSHWSCSID
jgi:hypothetical protein